MIVTFSKQFSKQLDWLNDQSMLQRISRAVQQVIAAKSAQEITNLKKLQGHSSAYRIRIGDYRIGLFIEGNAVLFAFLGHRRNIYNQFP